MFYRRGGSPPSAHAPTRSLNPGERVAPRPAATKRSHIRLSVTSPMGFRRLDRPAIPKGDAPLPSIGSPDYGSSARKLIRNTTFLISVLDLMLFHIFVAGNRRKILSCDVNDLLVFADCTRHPLRNRVIVLLAAKAGLRSVEVAQLTWDMVLDPTGDVGSVIELRDIAAENGSGRLIPAHPDLRRRPRRLS